MDHSPLAARFVAFFCFLNNGNDGECSPEQAGELARENWKQFLPYASDDLVKLLAPQTDSNGSGGKPARRRSQIRTSAQEIGGRLLGSAKHRLRIARGK